LIGDTATTTGTGAPEAAMRGIGVEAVPHDRIAPSRAR
jgi:hypothetical protein